MNVQHDWKRASLARGGKMCMSASISTLNPLSLMLGSMHLEHKGKTWIRQARALSPAPQWNAPVRVMNSANMFSSA